MTEKEKYKILEKEILNLYSKQEEEGRKQKFKSEVEAIEYDRKHDKEIKEYIKKRKKELGINTK